MSRKGLTLIEILVAVTVLSILTVTLYTVFKSGLDAWSKSEARLDIFQNARIILDQITRELVGAFVDDGAGAEFTGEDGDPDEPAVDGSPDKTEFITDFGGSIYKIKYELDQTNDILQRKYIKEPPDYTNEDYENAVDEDDGIEEGIVEFGFLVSSINFYYWEGSWSDDGTWNKTPAELPEAVKIVLVLQDAEGHTFPFETYVYLPNSE